MPITDLSPVVGHGDMFTVCRNYVKVTEAGSCVTHGSREGLDQLFVKANWENVARNQFNDLLIHTFYKLLAKISELVMQKCLWVN